MKKLNFQKGQILLITIMLVATLLTVVLAVTFKSTTETQLTKLEEESQKALSAAEAGVEAALQKNVGEAVTIGAGGTVLESSGLTGEAVVGTISDSKFVTPLLQKDQQYTFYLSNYPGYTSPLVNVPVSIYFQTEGDCPSLELTLVSTSNLVSRQVSDPCNQLGSSVPDLRADQGTYPVGGYNFSYQTVPVTANNHAIMIIRTLFAATRIGILRNDGNNLPLQGKYVTSEAKSPAGVSKKVQLFQSFPQIPAEFFVTSF